MSKINKERKNDYQYLQLTLSQSTFSFSSKVFWNVRDADLNIDVNIFICKYYSTKESSVKRDVESHPSNFIQSQVSGRPLYPFIREKSLKQFIVQSVANQQFLVRFIGLVYSSLAI